ncbi:MAG: c-type cytochrome [Burkholderiales bacterium]
MTAPSFTLFRRALAALALASLAATAQAADTARGQQLYNSICAQCHNPGGNPGPGPVSLGANNPARITAALDNVDQMRPYQRLLSANDIVDLAAYLGVRFGIAPPAEPPTADAIEYYHAAFDHYFVTAIAGEITKLDDGTFAGWARTGRSFKVYTATGSGLSPVCRFFSTAFAPKSSHFYTASPSECDVVKTNADWGFEGEVFYVGVPAADGTCAGGLVPVYRLYNNGQGAAPNHRFTTELQVRQQMLDKGWVPEGQGLGVTMCVHG